MRTPRSVATVLLAVLLGQSTGCHSFRPMAVGPGPPASPGTEGEAVRVTFTDGTPIELMNVYEDGDSIRGVRPEGSRLPVTIPKSRVWKVEKRYFSWKKTLLLTGTAALVLTAAFGMMVGEATDGACCGDWTWG